jgi:hypothetical protein
MEYAPATHLRRMRCMRDMSFLAVAICIVRHRLVQRLSAVSPLNALSSVPPCSSSRVPSVMYRSDRLLHRMPPSLFFPFFERRLPSSIQCVHIVCYYILYVRIRIAVQFFISHRFLCCVVVAIAVYVFGVSCY